MPRRPRLTAWWIYWIDGRWIASDVQAKLAGAVSRLGGRGDEGAMVVIWTPQEPSDQAQALLRQFVTDNLPALDAGLRRTRAQR